MDCLQLLFIGVEEAVSWTNRFLTRKIWPKNRSLLMKKKFESKYLQKFYVSSKQEKECYRKTTSYLEQPSRHFCQQFMRRTTQQTFLAINLASQQKTTKLYFSSQVKKQLKLLTVSFKPLRCCLRSDKLVNCQVWKFCKDLFLNFRVIWSGIHHSLHVQSDFRPSFSFFLESKTGSVGLQATEKVKVHLLSSPNWIIDTVYARFHFSNI